MKKRTWGSRIKELFASGAETEEFYEELEELLIAGDIGAAYAMEISDELRGIRKGGRAKGRDALMEKLKEILRGHLAAGDPGAVAGKLNIMLVLGVNGVGKTTTIAKMADYYRKAENRLPIMAAGDTFRAAAIDQLKLHGQRLDLRVVHQQPGSDPGAVLYDCIESASSGKEDLILADTAGRMHNKSQLVKELQKIDKIIAGRAPDAVYRKVLVIDATTGQNGLRQAEIFHEAVGIDFAVLTKYDSTAKGGNVLTISRNLGIPFGFIGTGEKYGDLHRFDAESYLDALLGL